MKYLPKLYFSALIPVGIIPSSIILLSGYGGIIDIPQTRYAPAYLLPKYIWAYRHGMTWL